MLFSILGLLYFLSFAPRCTFAIFQFVAYSRVSQCGSFNVSFSGGKPPAALPLTLTVIPFNSTPLAFIIPDSAWDVSTSSGSYVTFLPLQAGVSLMASLDDAAGNNAALISDVFQVLPSTNTSCLSSDAAAPAPFQLVNSSVSQCSPFSVSRNASSLDHPLSARVLIPTSLSFKALWTGFHTSQGVDTFTYIMSVAQGLHIALLFDDGQGNRQVSSLLSVGGGESSPSKCLEPSSSAQSTGKELDGPQSISKPAVIAISVTSSVIVLVILILGVVFVRRERRKLIERVGGAIQNRRSPLPRPLLSPPAPSKPASAETSGGEVPSSPVPVDPVYPQELFMLSSTGSRARQSARSTILAPLTPTSLRSSKSRSSTTRSASTRTKHSTKGTSTRRRLADLDIAGLLELADQQPAATETPHGYPGASPHTVTPVATPSVPPSPSPPSSRRASNRSLARRELSHQEPDVPLSPLRRLSQEWLALGERPSTAAAAASVGASRSGLTSRVRPLPVPLPFPRASVFAQGKKV